jgi:hypothetical protein
VDAWTVFHLPSTPPRVRLPAPRPADGGARERRLRLCAAGEWRPDLRVPAASRARRAGGVR